MPLRDLFKTKLLIQKHWNVNEESIDSFPFWKFEEYIKIVNELTEEEEKKRKKDEEVVKENTQSSINPNDAIRRMTRGYK